MQKTLPIINKNEENAKVRKPSSDLKPYQSQYFSKVSSEYANDGAQIFVSQRVNYNQEEEEKKQIQNEKQSVKDENENQNEFEEKEKTQDQNKSNKNSQNQVKKEEEREQGDEENQAKEKENEYQKIQVSQNDKVSQHNEKQGQNNEQDQNESKVEKSEKEQKVEEQEKQEEKRKESLDFWKQQYNQNNEKNEFEDEFRQKNASYEINYHQNQFVLDNQSKIDNIKITQSNYIPNKSLKKSSPIRKSLSKEINKSKSLQRSKVNESLVQKKIEREEITKNIETITQQIKQKVREWTKQQKQIERRKEINTEKEKVKKFQKQIEKQKEKQNRLKKEKEQKRKKIVQKIEQMNENRKKREIYLNKQNLYEDYKSLKQLMSQFSSLKVKEKKQSLPSLKRQVKSNKKIKIEENKPGFNVYVRNKSEKSLNEGEKAERRRKFNNKVRSIPVNINQQKRMKLLVENDKSQNMLKYQFLNRRGFSDYEIYEKSKNFELPQDQKKIGNKYLQQLREQNKGRNMKIANSRSVDILWSVPQKSEMGLFLDKIKAPKEKKHILYNNDLDALLYYQAKKRQKGIDY